MLLTNQGPHRSSAAAVAALYELPLSQRARAASRRQIRDGLSVAASCGHRSFVLFLP